MTARRRGQRKQAEPDLGILAGQVLFAMQKELFETLAQQGHSRLRPRHGAVLAYLDEEGSRATELSAQSGQHKQVIGTLVDELVELGYVRREPDPQDRRAKLIVPTALGRDEMTRSDAIMAEIERRHAAAVGEDAYAAFKATFTRIAALQRSRPLNSSRSRPGSPTA
ncbi:MarR family transcriptional regulator [Sphaerisporangium rufum]|uniref:MarR family transcriptional regulator n=1 Tax=Sphaerisporangium rufum TaxID=1381558 RepID=A0A919RAB1_9ACTN|nr:MarR family winged helix-turn-helix transcriptional regulator [Sphaerisporangium rufum]GII80227.1 MarR family transcriptional regulator [Sphaerisporangium rufum]